MAGDKVEVPVDADTRQALARMAALQAMLETLARKTFSARILADDAALQASLAKITAQLIALDKRIANPKLGIEGAAKAEAELLAIAAQMDKLSGKIVQSHVRIDDNDAERRIALLVTQLTALQKRLTDLRIGVTDPGALAKIEALKAALATLHDQVIRISAAEVIAEPDPGRITASLNLVKRLVRSLGIADIADVNVDPSRMQEQLVRLKQLIARVPGSTPGIADLLDLNVPPNVITAQLARLKQAVAKAGGAGVADVLDVNLNTASVQTQLRNLQTLIDSLHYKTTQIQVLDPEAIAQVGALRAALSALHGEVIRISVDDPGAVAKIAELATALGALHGKALNISIADPAAMAQLAEIAAALGSLHGANTHVTANLGEIGNAEKAIAELVKEMDALTPATAGAGRAAGVFAGGWGFLNARLLLFGGLLPGILGGIAAWHLGLDLAVEALILVTGATLALGAAVAAAAPTVQDMYRVLTNIHTVATGLNLTMPGLSGGFQQVVDAVKPNVYVLFGEAVNAANQNMGVFQQVAQGAAQVLDNLGARAAQALGSKGFAGLIKDGVGFLQGLGNVVGNIFGIIGNLFKVMPGYAKVLLQVLQDVTGALEAMTANPIVQGIARVGLALHGAVIYGGLLATGLLALGIPLGGLGNRFAGLARSTETAAAKLDKNAGLTQKIKAGWTDLGNALPVISGRIGSFGRAAEDAGAKISVGQRATNLWQGALGLLSKVPVWGWVAIGVAALGGLVYWLGSSKDAAQQWYATTEQTIVSQTTFAGVVDTTKNAVKDANTQLAQTPKLVQQNSGRFLALTGPMKGINSAYDNWQSNIKNLNAQQVTEQGRVAQLTKIFGSQGAAMAAMNAVGIKVSDIATANADAWAKDVTQLQAYETALTTLAGFQGGQALAAQNALNYASSDTVTALQKIVAAEDQVLNAITSGRTAFDTFQQGIFTLAQNFSQASGTAGTVSTTLGRLQASAKLAGATLGGTTAASYALNQAFYDQVGNAQKVTDALQQQNISAGDLKTVVATLSGQLVSFAGNNAEARTVIVGLINNALGPGTVSLQNLNTWVQNNSTSLNGMNTIIGNSTVKAEGLTGTIDSLTKTLFANDVMMSSHVTPDMQTLTNAIVTNGTKSDAAKAARAQLIADYEKTGMSAKDATTLVDNLISSLNSVPKNVYTQVLAHARADGTVVAQAQAGGIPLQGANGKLTFAGFARGGRVPGYAPGVDSRLAAVSPGEYILTPEAASGIGYDRLDAINRAYTRRGKPVHARGFAGGGAVTDDWKWMTGTTDTFAAAVENTFMKAVVDSFKKATAATVNYNPIAGVTQWEGVAAQALAMLGQPAGDLMIVMSQIQTESGGNPTIVNTTDSNWLAGHPSVGLLQVIAGTFAQYAGPFAGTGPFEYGVSVDPLANIYAGLNYAIHAYPDWTSVLGHGHGYGYGGRVMDSGGWLPPGLSSVFNGTGGWERLSRTGAGGGGDTHINVHVHVPAGAVMSNPAQAGRVIAELLKSYILGGGTLAARPVRSAENLTVNVAGTTYNVSSGPMAKI